MKAVDSSAGSAEELGEPGFEAAWAEGRAITCEQVVVYTLEREEASPA